MKHFYNPYAKSPLPNIFYTIYTKNELSIIYTILIPKVFHQTFFKSLFQKNFVITVKQKLLCQ